MKRIVLLIFLLINTIANAQCPAPSNLVYSTINVQDVSLSWTENGTATAWDIAVLPDYIVGAPLPTAGSWVSVASYPYIITGLPPTYGCYVFFVRSSCSLTNVSQWVGIGSSGCSNEVNDYLASLLSNDNFSKNTDDKDLQIAPNPSNKRVQLQMKSIIDNITVFDSLGKVILIQTQNTSEIDIENLSKGVYFIDVVSENKHFFKKFIKE